MQERLAQGPFVALGLASTATAAEIRSAFLELTKTYHPARFGYMSPELQRLANEVFLSLRAAHDTIGKPRGWPNRSDRSGSYSRNRSGSYPAVARSDRSGSLPALAVDKNDRSGAFPAVPATVDQKSDRSGSYPALAHAPGKPLPAPGAPTVPGRPPTGPRLTAPSLVSPVEHRLTPPGGVRIGALRSPAAPAQPAQPARPTGRPPGPGPGAVTAPRPGAPELASALEQMQRGQWDDARAILTALAERAPEVPRYRALLCYARGREAQLAQRLDDARVELQEALQLDPDLQLAKTALAELFTRHK